MRQVSPIGLWRARRGGLGAGRYGTPDAIEGVRAALGGQGLGGPGARRRAAGQARSVRRSPARDPAGAGTRRSRHTTIRSSRAPPTSPHVFIETEKGTIEFELAVLDAPQTSRNFIALARKGFFNGLQVHRVGRQLRDAGRRSARRRRRRPGL